MLFFTVKKMNISWNVFHLNRAVRRSADMILFDFQHNPGEMAKVYPSSFDKWSIWDFSSVQSLSHVRLFATPWIAARQASLSITNSQSLPISMTTESVMPSRHLILCRPLLLLPQSLPASGSFQWVNSFHEVAKVLEFQLQHQSFLRTPRTDLL